MTANKPLPEFWPWFFRGISGAPGLHRLLNRWIFLHLAVGVGSAILIQSSLEEVAKSALLPLIAILVGLTFSWAGNAHAVLQSPEIVQAVGQRPGGVAEYVFTFQLCILVLLATIAAWAIPVLKLPYWLSLNLPLETFNRLATVLLFALASLAIRTSWHAVLGSNMLLLMRVHGRNCITDDEGGNPP